MSSKPNINVFGLELGSSNTTKKAPKKKEIPKTKQTPLNLSGEPHFVPPEARMKQTKAKPGSFQMITESHQLQSGKTLYFAAWTDQPDSWPYPELKTLASQRCRIDNASFGKNGYGYFGVDYGMEHRFRLGDFFQSVIRHRETENKVPRNIRFFPHGGIFISYASPQTSFAGHETSAMPSVVMEHIEALEAKGHTLLDVALDSEFRWIIITDQTIGWSEGIPADLISKIEHYHSRKKQVIRIPHLEGDSWFIQTNEAFWYSANLPQALYKCLTPQSIVNALAIGPDGQWLVQYEN